MATQRALFPRGRSMSRGSQRGRPRSRSSMRSNATMRSRSRSLGRVTASAKSTPSRRPRQRRRRNPRKPIYPGGDYTGRLPKPRRHRRDAGQYAGASGTYDYSGTFNEPDCGYIGFSSIEPYDHFYGAVETLCRTYLKQHWNAMISDLNSEVVCATSSGSSLQYTLFYRRPNPSSPNADSIEEETYTVTSVAGTPIYFSNVVSAVFGELYNKFVDRAVELTAIQMGSAGGPYLVNGAYTSTSGPSTAQKFDLTRAVLKFNNLVRYRIQNQTTGDQGATNADDVRNNPIVGKIYHHTTPVPMMADPTMTASTYWHQCTLRTTPGGLVACPRGTIAPYIANTADVFTRIGKTVQFLRPPTADIFRTCDKVTSFGLNPGEMKQGQLLFKYRGDFNTFLRNMWNTSYGAVTKDSFGTCHMLAFSKRMPTGANAVVYSFDRYSQWTASIKRKGVSFKRQNIVGAVVSA